MQGHLRKRSKDSWTVVVELGRDAVTGKRRQLWRTVRGTKRDAEALLVQLLHQRETGVDAPPGRLSVRDYLDQWLAVYVQPNTAPKTFRRYEQLLRVHVVPVIGSLPLDKVRPLHVQEVYKRVLQEGRSARTALHCHRVLRQALQQAVRWQLAARNPADAVEAPRPDRWEVPAVQPAQIRRLLSEADGTLYGPLVQLAVTTGLRLGEILGLRWQDVDLDAEVLFVRQTCQWLAGEGFLFRQPKSHRSARPVALPGSAVDRLRQHRLLQLEGRLALGADYHDMGLVFASQVGGPIHPSNLRKAWLGIAERAGLRGLRFHDLRHAHASLLLRQGAHPKIVSERLGHSTVGVTLDIYSHVVPNLQADVARSFDEALANG